MITNHHVSFWVDLFLFVRLILNLLDFFVPLDCFFSYDIRLCWFTCHFLSLEIPSFILCHLLFRNNILLNLVLKLMFKFDVRPGESLLKLTNFPLSLRLLLFLITWVLWGIRTIWIFNLLTLCAIAFELIKVFVGVSLVLELLPVHRIENVRNYLAIEVIRAFQLVHLLILSVENAHEHIDLAHAWQQYALLKQVILSFAHHYSSLLLVSRWACWPCVCASLFHL